jgi:RimJ/RimL family protein N-acetyltransferase
MTPQIGRVRQSTGILRSTQYPASGVSIRRSVRPRALSEIVMTMQQHRVRLVPITLEEVREMVEAMSPSEKAELSAAWLEQLQASTAADPFKHGFSVVYGDDSVIVGKGGFKGPPSAEGVVEIAYMVLPEYQGQGFGTAAAQALVDYAFSSGQVRCARAHTLPESNASTRILTRCGFAYIGEVVDPDDGLVWRWEKRCDAGAEPAQA